MKAITPPTAITPPPPIQVGESQRTEQPEARVPAVTRCPACGHPMSHAEDVGWHCLLCGQHGREGQRTYSLHGTTDGRTPRVHVLATGEAISEQTRGPDTRDSVAAILRKWRRKVQRRCGYSIRIERTPEQRTCVLNGCENPVGPNEMVCSACDWTEHVDGIEEGEGR